jgi:hypothetical protein
MHDVVLGAIDGDGIVRGVHVLVRGPLADVRAGPLDQVLDIDLGGGVEAADGLDVAAHFTSHPRFDGERAQAVAHDFQVRECFLKCSHFVVRRLRLDRRWRWRW